MEFLVVVDGVSIYSNKELNAVRYINEEIQKDDVFTEETMYEDYKPTNLQIKIENGEEIKVVIPYTTKLSEVDARHAIICFHDHISHWRKIETTYDQDTHTLSASFLMNEGTIGLFINRYWYSSYTQRLANEFPIWTDIRNKKESLGQKFLNYYAIEFEGLDLEMQDMRSEKFIDTLNENMLAWIYAYPVPQLYNSDEIIIYNSADLNSRNIVYGVDLIQDFLLNVNGEAVIIDYAERILYSLTYYDKISGQVNNIDNRQTFESKGTPHQVWNAFDEFGLLLGVNRLYLESNKDFRERIKDVFRYPANSGDLGLTHALGRELGMIKRLVWKDDTKNLYLKGNNLDARTLRLDGKALQRNEYSVDRFGHIIIQARKSGKPRVVTIIKDIIKHELHDKSDVILYRNMFTDEGLATDRLMTWVEYINQVAPVMWGRFNWDEGYWDTIDRKLTGVGYIPNIWDSNIEIWRDYKIKASLEKEKF